ncbi:hypothetical protein LYNGBM3L_38530 [Moorena producens 3L]|uniref:Uncharacterized protein n=1 Tax=Moorena producens 3L TaxID=489825 RepID=F4XV51_9CYAN|nr:hypothetical protein LYNGBM3L_38530 [Moorena producens 3L]OLT64651.1 hypothetical protein BI334_06050 [Moorena producens 3L]
MLETQSIYSLTQGNIGSRESGIGNRESGIGNREKIIKINYFFDLLLPILSIKLLIKKMRFSERDATRTLTFFL